MTRYSSAIDYLEIYTADRDSMLYTMVKNMQADLEAGYDYFGQSITRQRAQIDDFKRRFDSVLDMFKGMTEENVNRWCFYELKKLGASA